MSHVPLPKRRDARLSEQALRRNLRARRSTADETAAAPEPTRHPAQQRIRVLGAMGVAAALFAVAGLPAYGAGTAPNPATPPVGEVQTLEVNAEITVAAPTRDPFRATSPEQLAELALQQTYLASGAQSLGDDYPWPYEATDDEGGPLSPLNYYYRECVDFVAWRLNRDAGFPVAPFKWKWADLTPNGGDGSQWLSAWRSNGWPVSDTPIPGSVAYTGGNHVAYVKQVLGGGFVVLEEYNWVPHVYSQRTVPISTVVAFLYPPPA